MKLSPIGRLTHLTKRQSLKFSISGPHIARDSAIHIDWNFTAMVRAMVVSPSPAAMCAIIQNYRYSVVGMAYYIA